jgi:hypothetical protein
MKPETTYIEIKLTKNITGITRANIMLGAGWRVLNFELISHKLIKVVFEREAPNQNPAELSTTPEPLDYVAPYPDPAKSPATKPSGIELAARIACGVVNLHR